MKPVIQKSAEATTDLIGNNIAEKSTKVSWILPQNSSGTVTNETENTEVDREILKKMIYISRKNSNNINDLRFT